MCLEGCGWKSRAAGETQSPLGPRLRCGCIRSGDPEVLRVEGQPSFLSPGGRLWDSRGRPVSPDSEGAYCGDRAQVRHRGRRAQTERLGTASLCPKEAGRFQVSCGALRSKPRPGVRGSGKHLTEKELRRPICPSRNGPPRPTTSPLDAASGDSSPPRYPGQQS